MPHSTVSNTNSPPAPAEEDTVLPDAPTQGLTGLRAEEGKDGSENALHVEESTRPAPKLDIKLEDLFNDDDDEDDDEEFPSSGVADGNVESSPPTAPVYDSFAACL